MDRLDDHDQRIVQKLTKKRGWGRAGLERPPASSGSRAELAHPAAQATKRMPAATSAATATTTMNGVRTA